MPKYCVEYWSDGGEKHNTNLWTIEDVCGNYWVNGKYVSFEKSGIVENEITLLTNYDEYGNIIGKDGYRVYVEGKDTKDAFDKAYDLIRI